MIAEDQFDASTAICSNLYISHPSAEIQFRKVKHNCRNIFMIQNDLFSALLCLSTFSFNQMCVSMIENRINVSLESHILCFKLFRSPIRTQTTKMYLVCSSAKKIGSVNWPDYKMKLKLQFFLSFRGLGVEHFRRWRGIQLRPVVLTFREKGDPLKEV